MLIKGRARLIRKMMKRMAGSRMSQSLEIVKQCSEAGVGAGVGVEVTQVLGQTALIPKAGQGRRGVAASLLLKRRAQSVRR